MALLAFEVILRCGGGSVFCVLWGVQNMVGIYIGVSVKHPLLVVTTKNVSRVYEMPLGIEDESSLEERHDSSQPWFTFHWAIFQLWDLERGFNLCES